MANSDLWIEAAAGRITGCPLATMQHEFSNTAREYFTRCPAWVEELAEINVTAGQHIYTLAHPDTEVSVVRVENLRIPDRDLSPSYREPTILGYQEGETPTTFWNQSYNTVGLWPRPTKDTTMIARVWLVATDPVYDFPEDVSLQHFEPLLDGLLGRLMFHKNKPYTDDNGAAYHLRRFRSGMNRVRADALSGKNKAENYWGYPGFARGRMYL